MRPRPALQPLPHFVVPELLLYFLIATRRTPNNVIWRFLGFILYTWIHLHAVMFTTGDAGTDLGIGSIFAANIFTAVHFLWLNNPLKDFRHKKDRIPPDTMSFPTRVYWAACLRWNIRGIDWNCQNSHLPPSPLQRERWPFIFSTLLRVLKFILLVDFAQSYIHRNPFFKSMGHLQSIHSQGLVFGALNLTAFWTTAYATLSIQYLLLGILSVSLGVSKSEDWPDFFGKWSDAYTIRRFWGRTWHQILRRFVSSIGKFLVHQSGFTPGSWGSSYIQLYAAFIISGVMHCMGDMMVGPKYFGTSFPFFIYQAIAITFEDIVIGLARRAGFVQQSTFTCCIGYIWVATWFYFTAPQLSWTARFGMPETLPFSLVRGIGNVTSNGLDASILW